MDMFYLVIGLVIGIVIGVLLLLSRNRSIQSQLMLAQQQMSTEQALKEEAKQKIQTETDRADSLLRDLTAAKMSISSLQTALEAERQRHAEEAEQHREQQARIDEQRTRQFQAQLETVREQFQNMATRMLEQSADKLKVRNTESMEQVTAPLRENLTRLNEAIHNTNQETAKSTASLSEQLRAMAEQTMKIDHTATRLTNVMRGSNKIQGNWGELILTEILEQNGLQEGVNYDVQQTLTDEKGYALTNDDSGRRMIPDVILHYPKNEDVIIDAKMSIESYYLYVNSEDELSRKKYADDLVKSIRTQFTNLSKKDYGSYVKAPRHAIDFVIMFVPHEGALQLALATDKRLWNDAFEKRVFITSQQNLMAILKMIEIAWRQYSQTENQLKVYGLAEEMLKRVGEFIKRFDKVKKDIDTLSKDYDDAYNKAYTGRQSIVQKANELKQLGVKEAANQPIPSTNEDILGLEPTEKD